MYRKKNTLIMFIKNSSSFNLKSKIHKAVAIALISAGFIPASHAAETERKC